MSVSRSAQRPIGVGRARRRRFGATPSLGSAAPMAVVMGGWDIVRPLTAVGVRCAVFAPSYDPIHHSRLVSATLPFHDPWHAPEAAVAALLSFAGGQAVTPVLIPPDDPSLMLVSRHRARLGGGFHLPLAEAALVEDLFDKGRFARLAERLGLPVPRSRVLTAAGGDAAAADLRPPLILKPLHRGGAWAPSEPMAKAVHAATAEELDAHRRRFAPLGVDLLAQELVPGPESSIESFHAVVARDGRIAGAFTGRKIRTWPQRYGESAAVEITAAGDVDALGRDVVAALDLRGPAKLDFKRAPDGGLHLLEVNPRLNLWSLPGARAGVNLPALTYADAVGAALPTAPRARAGVRWADPVLDVHAAPAHGLSRAGWLWWLARCETLSGFAWDDPLPLVRGRVGPAVRRRVDRRPRPAAAPHRDAATPGA